MCRLLTDADYARYGHERLPVESQERVDNEPNAIECMYMTADELNLDLQPTTESARLAFAAGLRRRKERLAEDGQPTMLATNLVPGADESWFDYWTATTTPRPTRRSR